jgi:hypothetical protein
MISRIVNCTVQKENLPTFRQKLNSEFVPRIKQQTGFVDLIEAVDPNTGAFVCNTLWKSQNDVKNYDTGLFQEIATTLGPLMVGPPTVQTLEVETSTPHKIAAGKSAAA